VGLVEISLFSKLFWKLMSYAACEAPDKRILVAAIIVESTNSAVTKPIFFNSFSLPDAAEDATFPVRVQCNEYTIHHW
jgi:hypothetical protein